jgi:preprotein translocase subunit SecD
VRDKYIYSLLLIVVITGITLWVNFAPGDMFLGRDVHTRLGLDLQGGMQVLLSAAKEDVTRDEMQTARGVLELRVNGLGVGETVVQLSGEDRIIVELPGVVDTDQALEILRGTGSLEFIDSQGQFLQDGTIVRTSNNPDPVILPDTTSITSTGGLTDTTSTAGTNALTPTSQIASGPIYESITSGKDLDTNQVAPTLSQSATGLSEPAVSFAFTGESSRSLANFTARNVGQPMCIVLDNRILSCPVIQSALSDGSGIITTNDTEDRDTIFSQLKYGALPIALQVETSRTVSATLGEDSVEASTIAGIVGLAVVAFFMILYYRLPGVLAVIALLIYTSICFAFYRLIPITLTLAGIAGFILSIGLAVDANVLIFARLKEELRRKKEMRKAIEAGFNEAWPAIRDSSVSTLITSIVLFLFGNSFGVSIIKGFALTLGLGIIVSLFSAIFITRTFLRLVAPMGISRNLWFFGINPNEPELVEQDIKSGRTVASTSEGSQ